MAVGVMTREEVWQMLVDHEKLLRREVARGLPSSMRSRVDDAYSECVTDRAHAIMSTYDPDRGSKPITHLCACVRWYVFKWKSPSYAAAKRRVSEAKALSEIDPAGALAETLGDGGASEAESEVRADLSSALAPLPEADRRLLEWALADGFTSVEIGEHLGTCPRRVRKAVADALGRARSAAAGARLERLLRAALDEDSDAQSGAEE
jgi:DNA-directed RNA polymerase specialized sigma24 family protein